MATLHLQAVQLLLLDVFWIASGIGEHLINVSEDGTDTLPCLFGNTSSCKTMSFVLKGISEGYLPQMTSILVNVTYNQTIATKQSYSFSDTESLTVTVYGTGSPFINCKLHTALVIMADKSRRVDWVWNGLVFSGCGSLTDDDHSFPGVKHINLHSLLIHRCRLLMTYVHASYTPNVTISHSELGNRQVQVGYCPKIEVVYYGKQNSKVMSSFLFSNNTFAYCQVPSSISYGRLTLLYNYDARVRIIENKFFSIVTSRPMSSSAIVFISGQVAMLTIQDNTFQENSLRLVLNLVYYEQDSINYEATFIIQQNRFLSNTKPVYYWRIQSGLIFIDINHKPKATLTVLLLENQFINNNDLFVTYIDVSTDDGTLSIIVDKLTVANNTAATIDGFISFVNLQLHNLDFDICITNVTAEGNIANTDITSNDFNSYIFSVSNVDKMYISDVTFYNNVGTPIVLRSDNSPLGQLYLHLSGNLLFVQNSGLFGGACAFYNIQITLGTRGQARVKFQENAAVYGGAVYIQTRSITVAYQCHMQLTFINNSAVTAGNSVYFATNPNETLQYNKDSKWRMNRNIDIRSLATSISFIPTNNHSTFLSIFPGQNIIFNISITDFFGFPSSCTADVYLRCDNRLYSCTDKLIKLKGPETVVLALKPNTSTTTVDTALMILSPEGLIDNNISVMLRCRNEEHTGLEIPLNITMCPLGFVYSQLKACANVLN